MPLFPNEPLHGRQLSYADAQFLNFVPSPIARGKRDGIFYWILLVVIKNVHISYMCVYICVCIFICGYSGVKRQNEAKIHMQAFEKKFAISSL